ncbi:MAG TPA: YbhN family protein, partial [Thermoanaerobaculia bacterium]|nr:YbhN family protein [Thermoanaerobaculia bacterium]
LPVVGKRVNVLTELYATLRGLLSPGLLAMALGLAVVAWGAEGVGFFLVVREYAPQASLLAALFNYTVSTCLGSLSMLPGGLLAAEGSLTALLDAQGLDTATAASATLIIRAATLWFAVVLGLVALPYVLRKLAERTKRTSRT